MPEVLSQSQIDMLLRSMSDGSETENKEEKVEDTQGYKKYDFHSPKKFTRDKLKILSSVYENYSRILSSKTSNLFRTNCEMELVGVEEQRYYEFSNALNENDVLGYIDVDLGETGKYIPILMHVTNTLMLSMIDRMLGGSGDDVSIPSNYNYTDVEIALYNNIMEHITPGMKEAWISYIDTPFKFEKLEKNTGMTQSIGMDETVVIVVMNLNLGETEGKINICMPGTLLSTIFAKYEKSTTKNTGKHTQVERDMIMTNLKSSSLEMKVKLAEAEMLMSDVYNLNIGDVINLGKPKNSEVFMYVDNKPWFTGKLGVNKKNVAVKINKVKVDKKELEETIK